MYQMCNNFNISFLQTFIWFVSLGVILTGLFSQGLLHHLAYKSKLIAKKFINLPQDWFLQIILKFFITWITFALCVRYLLYIKWAMDCYFKTDSLHSNFFSRVTTIDLLQISRFDDNWHKCRIYQNWCHIWGMRQKIFAIK